MKYHYVNFLTLLLVLSAAGCKKKTSSKSPTPDETKTTNVANSCGVGLTGVLGLTDLKDVRAADLEVEEPVIQPIYSDDMVVKFLITFDPVAKDPNLMPQFGKIRITSQDGKVLMEKHTGSWSEMIAIPRQYNKQTLFVKVSGCVPAWRKVDETCGPEKSIPYIPNIDAGDSDIRTEGAIASNLSAQQNTCAQLAGPAAELLTRIGYLVNGKEDPKFDMTKYPAEQRGIIAAAAVMYATPYSFGAICASGLAASLTNSTREILSINQLPSTNLVDNGLALAEAGCGSEALKAQCLEKGKDFSWDGEICIKNTPQVVGTTPVTTPVTTPKESDCLKQGVDYKWQGGMCVRTVHANDKESCGKIGTWDDATKVCVKVTEKITSAFSFPLSLISENSKNHCVSLVGGAVNLVDCDRLSSQQIFQVEGLDGQYMSFKTLTTPAACLTVDDQDGVKAVDAVEGQCKEAKQKFVTSTVEQEGSSYQRIRTYEPTNPQASKCLVVKDDTTLAVAMCSVEVAWQEIRKEVFTFKPNGGGKPKALAPTGASYVKIRSALSEGIENHCLSFSDTGLTLGGDCPSDDSFFIQLQPDINNYYAVVSKKKNGNLNLCADLGTDSATLTAKVCDGLYKQQKFEMVRFDTSDGNSLRTFVAKDSNNCLTAPSTVNGPLTLEECHSGDYGVMRSQLFSIVGSGSLATAPTGANNDDKVVLGDKKNILGISLIATGALLAVAAPALAVLVGRGSPAGELRLPITVEIGKMAPFGYVTKSDLNKLRGGLLNSTPHRLVIGVEENGVRPLNVYDANKTLINSFVVEGNLADGSLKAMKSGVNPISIDSNSGLAKAVTGQPGSLEGRAVSNGLEVSSKLGKGRVISGTMGFMFGIGIMIAGIIVNSEANELGLTAVDCLNDSDPFKKFTCMVQKTELELKGLQSQEAALYTN